MPFPALWFSISAAGIPYSIRRTWKWFVFVFVGTPVVGTSQTVLSSMHPSILDVLPRDTEALQIQSWDLLRKQQKKSLKKVLMKVQRQEEK